MLVLVGLGVLGLVLLTIAADHLIIGAGRLAARLRLSPVVVGVVVIGFGTSAPELLVSGLAAARGDAGLAVGNLVGSNTLNVTMILGIAALVAPVATRSSVIRREAPLSIGAVALFAGAVILGLNTTTGAILAGATVVAMLILVVLARRTADETLPYSVSDFLRQRPRHHLGVEIARTVLGLAGTLLGAHLLVVNAADIAGRLGVPQLIVGFTLVAIGTSLPELVTAIQSQRRGESELLVGNLLGSNLFNSLAGGAVLGLAGGDVASVVTLPLLVAMVLVSLLAWALLFHGSRVSRTDGLVLLAAYGLCLPLLL